MNALELLRRHRWSKGELGWLGPFPGHGIPFVGAVWGLALSAVWWLAGEVWTAALAAVVVVAVDLTLSGARPLAATMRVADAALPPRSVSERDAQFFVPATDAVGLAAGLVVVLTRWAALAVLAHGWVLLAVVWAVVRVAAVMVARAVPAGEDLAALTETDGAERAGRRSTPWSSGWPWFVGSLVVAWWARSGAGVVAVGAAAAGTLAVINLGLRRRGVLDATVVGAAVFVGETVGLLAAAGAL